MFSGYQNLPGVMKVSTKPEPVVMLEGLRRSSLFTSYQKAFFDATGMGVALLLCKKVDEHPCRMIDSRNRFCSMLNANNQFCNTCEANCWVEKVKENRYSHREAKCFSGMKITAIPLVVGEVKIGYLHAAPVISQTPSAGQFSEIESKLNLGISARNRLEDIYMKLDHMSAEKYRAVVTLMSLFAIQLSEMANRIGLERQQAEPKAIILAKRFINSHLDEKITLDRVSREAGFSSFYFCKLFKQATGLSFTEYINRQRVEWAKRKLLVPDNRVTQVAFEVGYLSLSQFNRCFLKYAGESPTKYRERIWSSDLTAEDQAAVPTM